MDFNFLQFLLKFLRDESGNISLTGGDGSGDGNGDGGEPGDGDGGSGDPSGQTGNSIFPEGLDESITNDPSLKVFIKDEKLDYGNLLKSYVHAQKKMGEKGIKIPDNHSTDEDWNNFYNKLRPAELDQYELNNSLPDGTALNEEMFNGFKANAHKLGLSTKQAQSVLDWYNQTTMSTITQQQEAQQANYTEQVDNLKKEWGEGFQKEMNLAQRAVKEFADEADIKYLKESGLDGDPRLIKMFNKIGKGLLEDKFDQESHGTFGVTKADAQSKINTIMGDKSHSYFDKSHPNHKNAVNEMNKLFQATM